MFYESVFLNNPSGKKDKRPRKTIRGIRTPHWGLKTALPVDSRIPQKNPAPMARGIWPGPTTITISMDITVNFKPINGVIGNNKIQKTPAKPAADKLRDQAQVLAVRKGIPTNMAPSRS